MSAPPTVARISSGHYMMTWPELRDSYGRGASIRTLLRRMYLYWGGRKARAARRRLNLIARRDPWSVLSIASTLPYMRLLLPDGRAVPPSGPATEKGNGE